MRFLSYLKKFGIVLLGLTFPLMTYAQNFSDVPYNYKHQQAITSLSNLGILNGYSDGTFKPDNSINRAEFTKVVIESLYDSSTVNKCISQNTGSGWSYLYFPDVKINDWYTKYVCVAATNKVVNGYPNGNFGPENSINYAEGLKIILDAYSVDMSRTRTVNNPLLYIQSGDWYAKYLSYAFNKNLINQNKFTHPAKLMTRGELAEVLYRLNMVIDGGLDGYNNITQPISSEYTITIPKLNIIDLQVSIADPYNSKGALDVLKNGLGYYLSTPGNGKKMVLFGHSSGYNWDHSVYKQILRQIDKLKTGDKIYVNYQEKGYIYQIFNEEVMPATQLGDVMKDYGYEEMALYTCWPPDGVSHRYVVYASPI